MPLLRREHAGSDSFGHEWEKDRDVVEVTPEEAAALLAIADGGFSLVEPDDVKPPKNDDHGGGDGGGQGDGGEAQGGADSGGDDSTQASDEASKASDEASQASAEAGGGSGTKKQPPRRSTSKTQAKPTA